MLNILSYILIDLSWETEIIFPDGKIFTEFIIFSWALIELIIFKFTIWFLISSFFLLFLSSIIFLFIVNSILGLFAIGDKKINIILILFSSILISFLSINSENNSIISWILLFNINNLNLWRYPNEKSPSYIL